MKSIVIAALALTLMVGTTFAAGPASATATPVTLTAVVPEYLAIIGGGGVVNFNFAALGSQKDADILPTYTLFYNLAHRTVTVCAWVTPLNGTAAGNVIPTTEIYAQTAASGGGAAQFSGNCGGQTGNAVTMDTISNATANLTGMSEKFLAFRIATGAVPPVPDTYTGTLNVMAQAI